MLQIPVIQVLTERGGIKHHPDVDVLVWWRDVGQGRFPRITVMSGQFLSIPVASTTPPPDTLIKILLTLLVLFI